MDGMKPRGVYELRYLEKSEFISAGVEYFAVEMQELHSKIKERLQNSNQEYKHREDQHRREIQFEVGYLVLEHLRKERFPRGTYNNLKMKKIGSCKILRKFEASAYDIELPYDVGISPIFNIAYMYPYRVEEVGEEESQKEIQWVKQMLVAEKPQMEKIIDQRVSKNTWRKTYLEYLIKLKGPPIEYASWESEENIQKHAKTGARSHQQEFMNFSARGV
jgi:hypothetical protein